MFSCHVMLSCHSYRRELDNIRRRKEEAEEAEKEREDALYRQYEEHRNTIDAKQSSLACRLQTIHEEISELERAKIEDKEEFEDVMQKSEISIELEISTELYVVDTVDTTDTVAQC